MNINDLNLNSFQMLRNTKNGNTRLYGFSKTHGGYALDLKYNEATGDIIYCKLDDEVITSIEELPMFMIKNMTATIAMGEGFKKKEQNDNPFDAHVYTLSRETKDNEDSEELERTIITKTITMDEGFKQKEQRDNPFEKEEVPFGELGNPFKPDENPFAQGDPFEKKEIPFGELGNPFKPDENPFAQGDPFEKKEIPFGELGNPFEPDDDPFVPSGGIKGR